MTVLSGGERRRLALAVTVASGANFLVLDEPTNHLDLESREALEAALEAFPGTVLLVSHDRALLDAVAERTLAIEDGELHSYDGGWAEMLRRRDERGRHARRRRERRSRSSRSRSRRSRDAEAAERARAGRGGDRRARGRGRRRSSRSSPRTGRTSSPRRAQAQPRRAAGAARALGAALRAGDLGALLERLAEGQRLARDPLVARGLVQAERLGLAVADLEHDPRVAEALAPPPRAPRAAAARDRGPRALGRRRTSASARRASLSKRAMPPHATAWPSSSRMTRKTPSRRLEHRAPRRAGPMSPAPSSSAASPPAARAQSAWTSGESKGSGPERIERGVERHAR